MTPKTKKLIILGSTGSIGQNTLDVVRHLNAQTDQRVEVVGLAAGKNSDRLIAQARDFNVNHLAIADPAQEQALRGALPHAKIFVGQNASVELIKHTQASDVTAAIVGAAGLQATFLAAQLGRTIGLANKETLVAAGHLFMPLAKKSGAQIIPVDSEHSAIFQCLQDNPRRSIKQIILTASGGPFLNHSIQAFEKASPQEALKHPTWAMGQKISIDSATMMNKALEMIEAHYLFDLPSKQIQVIIHPQSIVHSFVEFCDHASLAQLGQPDMRMPIQHSLTFPHRLPGAAKPLDWQKLSSLTFSQPQPEKFKAIDLAYQVIDRISAGDNAAGAVFNAANEQAVAYFLAGEIPLGKIVSLVSQTLNIIPSANVTTLEQVQDIDQQARGAVQQFVSSPTLSP